VTRPRDWDARDYDRQATAVQAWGRSLLDRLELRGDEHVLDAGCGSGAVTAELLERLPRGRVVAVDGSPAMVDQARAALAGDPRATVVLADLVELELEAPVDVVFSSAVFHWIADHDRLFARLRAALRPGGRLLAQCGGAGNVATVMDALASLATERPYDAHLAGWDGPWNFATEPATRARLGEAGFEAVETSLHTEVVRPEDPAAFLRTMVLGSHLDRLPDPLRDPFVAAVAARLPDPLELEYVRLTMRARRPA